MIRNSTFSASPCVSNPKRKLNRSHYEEAALRRVASFHCCALYHLFAPYTALFHFVWERLCVASNLRYGTVLLCVDAIKPSLSTLPFSTVSIGVGWRSARFAVSKEYELRLTLGAIDEKMFTNISSPFGEGRMREETLHFGSHKVPALRRLRVASAWCHSSR